MDTTTVILITDAINDAASTMSWSLLFAVVLLCITLVMTEVVLV